MIVGLKGTKGWVECSVGATLTTEGAIKQQRILLTEQQERKKYLTMHADNWKRAA